MKEKGKRSLNVQVLCDYEHCFMDVERSRDMRFKCVVWLEIRAATVLILLMRRRMVFVLRQHFKFKTEQCGYILRASETEI